MTFFLKVAGLLTVTDDGHFVITSLFEDFPGNVCARDRRGADLDGITIGINDGDRVGVVGRNGDGKSTLIGRLLFDSKAVMEDQLAAVERTSKERGNDYTDLALVTDGLRAEREQGITIDVAYRYFATAKRKFIINKLAMPPGANITMNKKTKPKYSSHALVNSDSSTNASTINTAPMRGPKKKVAPPKKVNNR